jgi:TRAP-type mannitol/chloroaromatic compound transport system permease large subunit
VDGHHRDRILVALQTELTLVGGGVAVFLPLLAHFDVDPVLFGILVALNLQTSFLTPPMAMSAYYLKGIAPPHVRLTQIFAGSLPYVLMVFITMAVLYIFPDIVYSLPRAIYGR